MDTAQETTPRRFLVWSALSASLEHLCQGVKSTGALLLLESDNGWEVAAASQCLSDHFQPNEPVLARCTDVPTVTVRSQVTSAAVALDTAGYFPFTHGKRRGLLIAGEPNEQTQAGAEAIFAEYREWQERAAQIRHSDLDSAYKMVAEASTSSLSSDRVTDLLLAGARQLLESDVAYLSVPVDDENFRMSRTLGIRTRRFRQLRVGPKQGLGGVVRRDGEPLRTIDYQSDSRLGSDLRDVTKLEGITSAVAVPVFDHDDIGAVLYAGSRKLTAFTAQDQQLLAEYAEATRLALRQEHMDVHRSLVARAQERRNLARILHDKLGRQLTQMTFATASMRGETNVSALMRQVESISASIEVCSSLLRNEIDKLLDSSEEAPFESIRSIVESILEVPSITGMARSVSYTSADGSAVADQLVPSTVANAAIQIGQEALFNAEHHSSGRKCSIGIDVGLHHLSISVIDDGNGDLPSDIPGHHGLRLMEQAAREVGGTVHISADSGGVHVVSEFPLVAESEQP